MIAYSFDRSHIGRYVYYLKLVTRSKFSQLNLSMEGLDLKKARTHKGRKHLDELKPKLVEGPKKTLFIKGNKTSESVTQAMRDLVKT